MIALIEFVLILDLSAYTYLNGLFPFFPSLKIKQHPQPSTP
jgi:hypothetical protein